MQFFNLNSYDNYSIALKMNNCKVSMFQSKLEV